MSGSATASASGIRARSYGTLTGIDHGGRKAESPNFGHMNAMMVGDCLVIVEIKLAFCMKISRLTTDDVNILNFEVSHIRIGFRFIGQQSAGKCA